LYSRPPAGTVFRPHPATAQAAIVVALLLLVLAIGTLAISGDAWPDDVRLSDIEPRFVCTVCGKRGADVRPDFHWREKPVAMMGYR